MMDNLWMVFLLGGFGGILYCHLIRPLTLKLLRKVMGRLRAREYRKQQQRIQRNMSAHARGYGWAWSAFRCEELSLEEIEYHINDAFPQSAEARCFDQGVKDALGDIRFYQHCEEGA